MTNGAYWPKRRRAGEKKVSFKKRREEAMWSCQGDGGGEEML